MSGFSNCGAERRLLVRAEIVAEVHRESLALERLDPVAVRDPRERLRDDLELLRVALEALQLLAAALEGAADEVDDEVLGELAEALEIEERDLGLDHPELGQVAPRLRLFGAEGRAEAVDLAERGRRRLEVELSGLREVRLVAEVVRLEEGRRPLDGGSRQDRRVDPDELALVEEVRDRLLHLRADAQHGVLLRRAHPEVAQVHEEVDAVLLRRDRVVLRLAQDLDGRRRHLVPARGALVLAHGSGDPERAFLGRALGGIPHFGRDIGARHDALEVPGSVADDEELDLSRGALVVEPPLHRRRGAGLLANPGDRGRFHKGPGL